eukprot:UN27533
MCDDFMWCFILSETMRSKKVISSCMDDVIHIWDYETGDRLAILKTAKGRRQEGLPFLRVSPNNEYLIACSMCGKIFIWDLINFQFLTCYTGHKGTVYWGCITSDSKYIISCSEDKTTIIWNIPNQRTKIM